MAEDGAMLLELYDVSKAYGSVVASDAVSLAVTQGEALGVIGPNGAGKTTLFGLITGAVTPDAGSIRLDGRDITQLPSAQRCPAGICRSHQIPHPFEKLTVFENLLVAACFGRRMREAQATDWCAELLELTGLLPKANRLGGSLALLDRKRLELARALATRPRLLLLDEIAGGLTEAECEALVGTISTIHRGGTTIIWIEHIVHALLAVVPRLMVLNFGRKIADGEAHGVMDLAAVREIYLGSPV
jgi:branched-chain amino acid transport system ATP-binding protein